jgi:hypothetical protein
MSTSVMLRLYRTDHCGTGDWRGGGKRKEGLTSGRYAENVGLRRRRSMIAFRRAFASGVLSGLSWTALALALVACGSSAQPADLPIPAAPAPPTEANAADLPTAAPVAVASAEPGIVSIPTAAPVRQELAATDPTGVVLGAGRPTLVELFAFW